MAAQWRCRSARHPSPSAVAAALAAAAASGSGMASRSKMPSQMWGGAQGAVLAGASLTSCRNSLPTRTAACSSSSPEGSSKAGSTSRSLPACPAVHSSTGSTSTTTTTSMRHGRRSRHGSHWQRRRRRLAMLHSGSLCRPGAPMQATGPPAVLFCSSSGCSSGPSRGRSLLRQLHPPSGAAMSRTTTGELSQLAYTPCNATATALGPSVQARDIKPARVRGRGKAASSTRGRFRAAVAAAREAARCEPQSEECTWVPVLNVSLAIFFAQKRQQSPAAVTSLACAAHSRAQRIARSACRLTAATRALAAAAAAWASWWHVVAGRPLVSTMPKAPPMAPMQMPLLLPA